MEHRRLVQYCNTSLKYPGEFHNVLARGGVVRRELRGATIQGDYLVRGPSPARRIMMTPRESEHERGFNFLRRTGHRSSHINTRNRWDDLIPVIPEDCLSCSGLGLSEGTAIIVTWRSLRTRVMGTWKGGGPRQHAAVSAVEKPYFVLSTGRRRST